MSFQGYSHERNWGARLTEYEYRGHAMIAMENRFIRVAIAAGKGTDILEFLYKPLDVDFMWRSYTGLRATGDFSPSVANTQGNFMDLYAGGWQELLPNAGVDCLYKGAQLGVHGEVCLLPWRYRIDRDQPDGVAVTFSVRTLRTPFYVEKTMRLDADSALLAIDELVRNESDEPMDLMWGHHPAFGWPFVDDSCRIFLPPCRVLTPVAAVSPNSRLACGQDVPWPLVAGRTGEAVDLSSIPSAAAHAHDMAYMHGMEEGWYAVVNRRQGVGFGLRWDHTLFPSLWFWQVYRGWAGYPWYGMNYVIALEPVSSYPPTLADAVKAGTQLVIAPGAELHTRLLAVAFGGRDEIHGISPEGVLR
jgi:hypothetical protein